MLSAEREKARRDAEDALRLKVAEKDQLILALQCKVEDLGRRIEQGSQQSQGEAQELVIESLLRERFPGDVIEPVGKGEHGGDVVQRILCPNGQPAGAILWESKRTRNYQANWLPKLRADQRAARAEVAVLVSQALPVGLDRFDLVDGVYVVEWRCLLPIATTLRQALLDIAAARQAGEGQATKIELVYQYLTGPRFRQRVQAIVEKFTELQADLDRERKFLLKQWSKRQAQIHGAVEATAGMYGDLQGIAGRTLLEIDGLAAGDAPLLPGSTAEA
jgi:hypothetical protein